MEAAGSAAVPLQRTWRLDERHYGALQGVDRSTARLRHGDVRYRLWRRSYDHRPPPVEAGSRWEVAADPRHEEVLGLDVPTGMPLHHDLAPDLTPRQRGGAYLEPEAAPAAAAEVAAQGR